MAAIPYSLRPLLGDEPDGVTAGQLAKLLGHPESQQADWKRQLNDNPKTNLDLAVDVAAFANATGGLIVVGLDEDGDSNAVKFVGVDDPGRLIDRIHDTVRARVHPPAPYSAHVVAGPDDTNVVLIAVEGSEAAPHAAAEKKTLIYPVRSGTGKGYLSEAQIADWYGRRLRRIAGQDTRTAELRSAAIPGELLDGDVAWLIITLAPARPGTSRLQPDDVEHYRFLLSTNNLRKLVFDQPAPWNPVVGHRALLATDSRKDPLKRAVLAVDGSGSAAQRWTGRTDGIVEHNLVWLTQEVFQALTVLVAHAIERQVSGTATASAEVIMRPSIGVRMTTGLGHESQFFADEDPVHPGSTPVSFHTVDLDALAHSTSALLQAVHLLGADIASAFGFAELPGVTPDGHLRPAGLRRDRRAREEVERWAELHGVDLQAP